MGKDRAVVFSRGENPACGVGEPRQRRTRRRLADVEGLVGEKILAADFRRDVAFADIGAARSRQAFGVSAGRQHAVEIHVGERGDQVADAGRADRQAVDLLEAARSVRIETLSRLLGRRARCRAFFLPWLAVRLPCHVGKRIQAVLGMDFNFKDRPVFRPGLLFPEHALGVEISVRRAVKFGGIRLERMRRETFHIDLCRGGETLCPQNVEALLTAIRILSRRQPVFAPRLIGRHERR